jgi:type II secretory pathway pseudopilin PulG
MGCAEAAVLSRRRGFSMVEIGLVLGVVALMIAGAMLFFRSASVAQKTHQSLQQLMLVREAVQVSYMGSPDYTGLDASVVAGSRLIPRQMVKPGATAAAPSGLYHAFNAPILVNDLSSGQHYQITFTNIPWAACVRMVTVDFGRDLFDIEVNGAHIYYGRTLTPLEAETACPAALPFASVAFSFF